LNRVRRLAINTTLSPNVAATFRSPENGGLKTASTNNQARVRALDKKLHQTIKAVTEDIEDFSFNTAIARLMELTNAIYENINNNSLTGNSSLIIGHLLTMLSPFAPHLTQELWHQLGNKDSIHNQPWPEYDPAIAKEDEIEIPVQVNGKLRDTIKVAADADKDTILTAAKNSEKIKNFTAGKQIVKQIYVPGRLVNLVIAN
jgi:leucyl-tRNA synthetase